MILVDYFERFLPFLELLGILSLATFICSLIFIPFLVSRMPVNYFHGTPDESPRAARNHSPLIMILRNLLGVTILGAGILMLFLPGQGLITMVIGLAVMQFPQKKALIRYLISFHGVRRGMDWLRQKTDTAPFLWPHD